MQSTLNLNMFLLEGTHRTLKRNRQTQNTLNVHTVDWQGNFLGWTHLVTDVQIVYVLQGNMG